MAHALPEPLPESLPESPIEPHYGSAVPAGRHANTGRAVFSGVSAIPLATRQAGLFRRLGQTDLQIYPVVLGASVFGWTADNQASRDILDRYFEFGGNVVDTADSYTSGRSEVIIGSWMHDRRNRDQMVLATKVGKHPDHPGLSPASIIGATEASLERLQTDRIDVLFFHGDDDQARFEDSLAAADSLIDAGKVRYLAASDYAAARLIEARILSAYGYRRFVALQTEYSLVRRRYEGELALVAAGQQLGVIPYYALANGFLTGKYMSRHQKVETTRQARAMQHVTRKGLRVLSTLKLIAAEHETSPATVALAWLLAKPTVTAPVTSASDPTQVDALMAASTLRLTRSQILDLDRVSA